MNKKLVNFLFVVAALQNYNLDQAMFRIRNMESNLQSSSDPRDAERLRELQSVQYQLQAEKYKRMIQSHDEPGE